MPFLFPLPVLLSFQMSFPSESTPLSAPLSAPPSEPLPCLEFYRKNPYFFRSTLDMLMGPRSDHAFRALPPQRIPWKPEHLATIGKEGYEEHTIQRRPWRISDLEARLKEWGFSSDDQLRFRIRKWAFLDEGVRSEDADRWRAILTDPDEVAWFAKNEETRRAEQAKAHAAHLVTCGEIAPLVATNVKREDLAQYLANNPCPERWRVLTAYVEPKILEYATMRAEDIREENAKEAECAGYGYFS